MANDLENGNADKETDAFANQPDEGEYGNLIRYISQYRDGRRASTVGSEAPKKKHWWQRAAKGAGGEGFETPEEWLNTDMKQGLSSHEVEQRRKKTGWNELTTEKENMFLKFLSYFTGPILYGKLTTRLPCSCPSGPLAGPNYPLRPQLTRVCSYGTCRPPRCRSS
jgi:H+-transporting ATPase